MLVKKGNNNAITNPLLFTPPQEQTSKPARFFPPQRRGMSQGSTRTAQGQPRSHLLNSDLSLPSLSPAAPHPSAGFARKPHLGRAGRSCPRDASLRHTRWCVNTSADSSTLDG